MTTETQAERLIGTLQRDHRLFKLLGYQCQPDGVFITFEPISLSLNTVAKWVEAAGGVATRLGTEWQDDNQVMYVQVRL